MAGRAGQAPDAGGGKALRSRGGRAAWGRFRQALVPAALVLAAVPVLVAAHPSGKATSLRRRLDAVLTDPALAGARIGCRVIEVESGRVLYSYHAADPLIPASNMKLATTAAALELLGRDFRFVTRLGLVGKDLVVVGAGDPNVSGRFHDGRITAVFEDWADRLRSRGITRIEGDLVGDDTLFDRQYRHPTWPASEFSSWYCAPVGALALNDSCVDVWVRPGGAPGRPALVSMEPPGPHHTLVNRAVTAAAGERPAITARRRPGSAIVEVEGRIPLGARPIRRYVAAHDPGRFFLEALKEVLRRKGIAVRGRCRLASAPVEAASMQVLATYTSSLERTVKVTNTRSQNLYAEMLFKLLGARLRGRPGTFGKGAAVVAEFLRRAGVGEADYVIADGSGLSRRNRLSAMHVTRLLRWMARRPAGETYRRSLATAGTDGGLRRRMTAAPYRGRVHAKTGTLTGVSALSGYVETLDGRLLAFSILFNDMRHCTAARAREIQDRVCRLLVRSTGS